jgi:hypothetical protein
MNQTLPLDEQRTTLQTEMEAVLPFKVLPFPRQDPVPPIGVIMNPTIAFTAAGKAGLVEWSIRLYQTRKAPEAVSAYFDAHLTEVLKRLAKGCGMGFVLIRVDPQIIDDLGLPLPGYVITGTASLANC